MGEFFFGCPVLQRFIQTTEPLVDWNLYDSDPWHELKGQVESERPGPLIVRRRALLCIAFSLEEIAFALKKLKHHGGAAAVREAPGPIRGPEDLEKILARIDEATEDLVAQLVNDRMINDELGPKQGTMRTREGVRDATSATRAAIQLLQQNWENVEELAPMGEVAARVFEMLHTNFDRRFGYLKTIFGEAHG